MSKFDFNIMDAAGYGFYRVWVERSYLLKLAFIPFLIKFACTIVVFVLDLDKNVLRQGLVLLPGLMAEGWVLAQFLRTLLKNERWPTILPPDINDQLLDRLLLRARGIVAATLVYGLIGLASFFLRYLFLALLTGNFVDANPDDLERAIEAAEQQSKPAQLGTVGLIPLLGLAFFVFWAFRLMWIYIPYSVLMKTEDYLKSLGGLMASAKMIVLFLSTLMPVLFVTVMLTRTVYGLFSGLGDAASDISTFIGISIAVFSELVLALVATTAFVWAMREFLPKETDLLKELPKLGEKK